jgi:hypothetical protein
LLEGFVLALVKYLNSLKLVILVLFLNIVPRLAVEAVEIVTPTPSPIELFNNIFFT